MGKWVYIESESGLFTVGFNRPDGKWEPASDHKTSDEAAARVHYLNGGLSEDRGDPSPQLIAASTELLTEAIDFVQEFDAYINEDDYDLPDPSSLIEAIEKAGGTVDSD